MNENIELVAVRLRGTRKFQKLNNPMERFPVLLRSSSNRIFEHDNEQTFLRKIFESVGQCIEFNCKLCKRKNGELYG